MRKIIIIALALSLSITTLTGCSTQVEKPEVLKENEISSMQIMVEVDDNNEDIKSTKREAVSNKTIEMVETLRLDDEFYKDGYYGVPVSVDDVYYEIPAVKLLNYYFIDLDTVSKMHGIDYEITKNGISMDIKEDVKLDKSVLKEGSINPLIINNEEMKIINDEKNLAINYLDKSYISLISLSEILPEDSRLYIDREMGIITNKKPDIKEHPETNNGLLRKNISIDDEHQLIVREGTYGKALVVYDIYGSSLDITPDNISFSKDLQNIFLHKTEDDLIYMFGLMGNYVEVYKINITEDLTISILSLGSIQKQAQNIYYMDDKYIAVGRQNVFGINIGEDGVNEVNLKTITEIKESGGGFNIINDEPYLTVKNNYDKLLIYKMNLEDFKLEEVKALEPSLSFEDVALNFMYSFVEDGEISIYAMDSTGYIYNIRYNLETDETLVEQTQKFKLFYTEEQYPVELSIDLVKTGEEGESELSLTVNGKYLGNNVLVFGVEDNWVYCSEYNKDGENVSIYSFRYNAITGIKDYSNAS